MSSILKVAVMLTAYDAMSREVQAAVGKSKKELTDLQNHAKSLFGQGAGLLGAGAAGASIIKGTIQDFADLQEGALSLKSVMMKDGGVLDTKQFDQMNKLAEKLGNKLPGTTSDFHEMFTTMIRSGVKAENILDGVGDGAANLAIALKIPYSEAGKFAAKMKEATGVADKEMKDFLDTIARTAQVGVDSQDMQQAFAKSTGALKLMNIQGLEASKSLSGVYAMLVKSGQSGETIGTGMTSIFKSFLDPKKMNDLNAMAQKFGFQMEFMDKKSGEFLGVENMMDQFDQMKNLTAGQKNSLSEALLGTGKDSNFMTILADKGVAGFNEMTKAMAEQATLQDKVDINTSGLNSQMEAFEGTITNISSAIGSQFEPSLTALAKLMNAVAGSIQEWVSNNPKLTKLIALIVSFTSAALMIAGVVKMIQGAIAIFKILNIVIAMNPFVLIIAGIILAASLLIVYWDDIAKFFTRLWNKIKSVAAQGVNQLISRFKFLWDGIKNIFGMLYQLFLKFHPLGILVKNFDKIVSFLSSLKSKFFNAGASIAKSIWDGIKSMANKPVEAISNIVKSMRDFLPFSPARTGAFKDLHKVKIVETIANSMKPAPMVNAMSRAVGATAGVGVRGGVRGGSSQGTTINYSPVVNIGAGANKADFMQMLNDHKEELMRMLAAHQANKLRTKFA
jgi:TP901 family phage tail tape measure protein